MHRFNYKGDIAEVRPSQLDFISDVLEKQGFKGPTASIENVGAAGDNFIANVKRISVTENGQTFKMIAKLAPDNEIIRQMAQIGMLFTNEQTVYTELLPKFEEMQKTAGVAEIYKFAKCYGCLAEAPNEVILLEDLNESEFKILDRFKPLSTESVKQVLKNLAIFHSLSYVLKQQEPETFERIKSKFGNVYDGPMSNTEDGQKFFEQLEATSLEIITDDKYKSHIKGNVSNIFKLQVKASAGDRDSQRLVIQQGDAWINNIMFKVKNDVPVECLLIDYQMASANNPVYDLMYMIFNSTSHEQRLQHYYEFLDYYHEELDNSLRNYGLKASMVNSRDQLDSSMKRYGKFMLATCIMVSNTLVKKVEDAAKMKDAMKTLTSDNKDDTIDGIFDVDQVLYKDRVEGLVDSFLEFGLL